jgi:O-antigen ligase
MTLSEPLSFAPEPNKIFWFAGYVAVLIFAVRRPNALLKCVQQNYVVLLLPALAFLSAIWSPSPGVDLYNSFQFLMTNLIGFVIVLRYGERASIHMLLMSLGLSVILSLAYYFISPTAAVVAWADGLRGIYHTKNEMASTAALFTLLAVATFIGEKRRWYLAAAACLGIVAVLATRSGTSIIATTLALSLVPTIFLYGRNRSLVPFAVGLQLIVCVSIAAFIVFAHVDLFDALLESIGKDSTLTGRTVLWGFAVDGFLHNPWLGHGFKGWWDPSNPNVFFLRYVVGQDLWYFHNVYLEISVSFGILGAGLMLLTLATSYKRALRALLEASTAPNIWNVLFLSYITIDCMAENALFVNHHIHQLILAMIFASTSKIFSDGRYGATSQAYLRPQAGVI